ncbi:MAG TPA: hypothetical protein VMH04_20270 [Candidatus Solibacter sp.]|nr:hypothetical protein [Candidatus Solibacter sp.]
MNTFKAILCGLAAIFIAETAYLWPMLSTSKATGIEVFKGLLVTSLFSLRFWIAGSLSFALFYAASRGGTVLRVFLFWIPTIAVSTLGFAVIGLYTYIFLRFIHQ